VALVDRCCLADHGFVEQSDLSACEQRLWEAFPRGALVDLRVGDGSVDDLASAARWGAGRTVRGRVIAELLLGACDGERGHVPAVRLAGARIVGAIDVGDGRAVASLGLVECYLECPPDFTGAASRSIRLTSCGLPGFGGRLLRVDGDLRMESCKVSGCLELRHAYVQGDVHLNGSSLACPGQVALSAGGITVVGGVFARDQFRLDGSLRLVGGTFHGGLFLEGAQLHNPGADTVMGDGMTVRGPIECTAGFYSVGTLSLREVQIRSLALDEATLDNPGGYALRIDHAEVTTYVRGSPGFTAHGEVCLNDTHVGTIVDFTGARIHNPGASSLTALGIQVSALINCCEGFDSIGEIELHHAQVGQFICFQRAHLSNPGGQALWAEHLQTRELLFQTASTEGTVDLRHAQLGVLHDDPATWPGKLRIEGLAYESLTPHLPACERLQWLHHDIDGYIPRAYEQLSAAYRRLGHPEEARTILLAKQRHRRRYLSPLPKAWGFLQDWTVGYGYRPIRAALGLLALWTIGTIAFSLHHPPTATGVDPHTFQPLIYTLGLMLPIIDFQQENTFTPRGAQSWLAFILICAGWVLATTVAAGITRALRREQE
jgi:hypothetical protein